MFGAGEPLVVINGLGMDMTEFSLITSALAERHKVLAFDNRGAGRSDKPHEPYSIAQMAGDTARVMEAAGFEQAAVLGISMGGRIALELTLEHPEKVKKLVLTSTAARTVPSWHRRLVFAVTPRLPLFKGKYPQPYYAFALQRAASSAYDGTDKLGDIHIPTLILHGKKDRMTPYTLAEEMHQKIQGSQMDTFTGGHMFFLFRERQRFLRDVVTFS